MYIEVTGKPPRATRPRNRRTLILDAAADLFIRKGYPHVSMSDIAAAVGIVPSALYRHFRSKEELLHESVTKRFQLVDAVFEAFVGSDLDAMFTALADAVLDHRDLGILWQRESRHLNPDLRDALREQLIGFERVLEDRIGTVQPKAPDGQPHLRAWAALAAVMSISFQRVDLPRDEYVTLLAEISRDIVEAPTFAVRDTVPINLPASIPATAPTGERLAAAAARLFAERGFQGVGVDDVAAEVGISGPSVYHHFGGKVDLLAAAMGEGARQLLSDGAAITESEDEPHVKLERLVDSYVRFSFANRHVLDLLITETANLPDKDRETGLGQQRAYVATWVDLLQKIRPALPAGHARVRVQAVLTLTNDIARTTSLRSQPDTQVAVAAIGRAILGLSQTGH